MDYGQREMTTASIIFWLVFVLPFVAFLVWLMRQDKRKGKSGLIVLAIIVIVGIVYMYWKTKGQ
ncbi:MAG TPA: hypothetical protein VFE53_18610 [Mucilaginibacter sp.]|jgi:cbb3-type cytochrome oxidase subunit 3|nr:hypothetical protein [Mucilaginibacter sp.]